MAEINNSVALGIKNDPMDIGNTLARIAQMRSLDSTTALNQQSLGQKQGVYDRNDGYSIPEVQGLASTKNIEANTANTHAELAGRVGNILTNDPTPQGVATAVGLAKSAGMDVSSLVHGHLDSLPPDQIKQAGQRLVDYGRSASSQTEQNPRQIQNRAAATQSGTQAGTLGIQPPPLIPTQPAPVPAQRLKQAFDDNANVNGTPSVNLGNSVVGVDYGKPGAVALAAKDIEGRGAEIKGNSEKLVADYQGYKEDAANASSTKYLLKNLREDAANFPTGKGANTLGAAKQWIQAAQQLPGIGPGIKAVTGDVSNPVAAFEAMQKNAGQLTRATLKDADGRAAIEYKMIQQQLPNAELSPKGLQTVTAQMTAPEDFKQAKLIAADKWRASHGGTISGFASDWNKNIGPGAFLFARLPDEERAATVERLNKSTEGKRTLQSIKTQMTWAKQNGLDSVID